jgi:hypothetical protein
MQESCKNVKSWPQPFHRKWERHILFAMKLQTRHGGGNTRGPLSTWGNQATLFNRFLVQGPGHGFKPFPGPGMGVNPARVVLSWTQLSLSIARVGGENFQLREAPF